MKHLEVPVGIVMSISIKDKLRLIQVVVGHPVWNRVTIRRSIASAFKWKEIGYRKFDIPEHNEQL